jgi:hypothetical protein
VQKEISAEKEYLEEIMRAIEELLAVEFEEDHV